ncbi:putative Glycosyl transferase, group 1 family protein [Rhodospirillaceae bacterium LM-1]|nr:putative Glycosyl transferase, group 1 family protein [Rhodospirillaceae bacterium LM-1]
MSGRRLKVGVLVDLERRASAGGHVKCWERFARAAVSRDDLDLTVHVQNAIEVVEPLSDHVRFVSHRPVFSTERLSWIVGNIPDHTDLSPWHPAIARALPGYDVVHTTDAFFAMAGTALRVCRQKGIPLVNSVHTDTPGYTRLYTRRTVERLFGHGFLSRLLLDRFKVDQRQEAGMLAKLRKHQSAALFSLDSDAKALEEMKRCLGAGRVGRLRRGIDKEFFNPKHRDRAWLKSRFGISETSVAVLFVGRVNAGKNVLPAAQAVADMVAKGHDVHFLAAGEGEEIPVIRQMLGARACLPGNVPSTDMGRLYASCDAFIFPSMLEVLANVVMEALASGLPVLVNEGSGLEPYFEPNISGLVVPDHGWGPALERLLMAPDRRRSLGLAARQHSERAHPSWGDVLAQDIMPFWRKAARWE